MNLLEFLYAPSVVFLTIVAPIWIVMHYRSTQGSSRGLDQGDREVLEELLADLDKMADRIDVLESILEQDHADWRKHSPGREGREERAQRSNDNQA